MAKSNKISGKKARKEIEKNLEITLAPLEPVIGNKDFKRRLKKAGKALTKGLKKQKSQLALERLQKLNETKQADASPKKSEQKNASPSPTHPTVEKERPFK
jgi:hypothetical protein